MSRGYACIGLDNPKCQHNVGGALRAAWIYDASMLVIGGRRFERVATDTMKSYRHIPVIRSENVLDVVPFDCVPVAVDIIDGAIPLPEYKHPERAFYIFGGEDCTLGHRIIDKCRDVVYVPMRGCMNLAASVNVVLYDRMAKSNNRGENDD